MRPGAARTTRRGAAQRGPDGRVRGHRRPSRRACSASPTRSRTRRPSHRATLHDDGVRLVMLTGDNRTTAAAVARSSASTRSRPRSCPTRKAEVVKRLQAEGRIVAMAGDGINDAPALAQAHVGIAMGTGTDVAMESAGVTLVKGDLRGIARARTLSRADDAQHPPEPVLRVPLQRCSASRSPPAFSIPFFGLLLSPMIASAAMSLQLGVGDHERPAPATRALVTGRGVPWKCSNAPGRTTPHPLRPRAGLARPRP